jgi:hypothetical protein
MVVWLGVAGETFRKKPDFSEAGMTRVKVRN